jgi:hypothetical protein
MKRAVSVALFYLKRTFEWLFFLGKLATILE